MFHQQVHVNDAWRVHKTDSAVSWRGTTVGNERSRILDQDRWLTYLQIEGPSGSRAFDRYHLSLSHQRQSEERHRVRSDGRLDIQGFDIDSYGAWLQLEKAVEGIDLTYGASYYQDRGETFRDDFNADGTFRGSRIQGPFGDDARYHLASAFLNGQSAVTDRLDLDLGLRHTYARADIGRVEDPATGNPIAIRDSWNQIVGSARASLQVDAADSIRLFAGVSQAFRSPNFSDLSRLDTARSNEIETPTPDLDPEEFLTFEIGAKFQRDRFRGTASFFYTDIEDLIVRTPTGRVLEENNEVTKKNAGDGFTRGIELSGSYELAPGLQAFGGFAWLEGEVDTFPTSDPVTVREPLDRLMPTNGFLGLRWDSADTRFWVEGLVQVADRGDKLSTRSAADTQRIPPGGTPGHEVVTLRAGWNPTENLSLTAGIENLTDEEYRAHGSGQNEPGRSLVLGVEVRF